MSFPENRNNGSYLGAVVFGILFMSILFWLLAQYGHKEPPKTAVSLLPPVSSTTAAAMGGSSLSKMGAAFAVAVRQTVESGKPTKTSEIIDLPAQRPEEQSNADNTSLLFTASGCVFDHSAVPARGVIVNEIAWMGSPRKGSESAVASGNNEWIELRSLSLGTVSLSGWRLQDMSGKFAVDLDGFSIKSGKLAVLERSDDDSSPAEASFIYSGALSNDGLHLHLYDERCILQDDIDALSGWPAGNAKEKKTMERDADGVGWHTSQIAGGTPGRANTLVISDDKKVVAATTASAISVNNASQSVSQSGNTQQTANNASGGIEPNDAPMYPSLKICEVQIESSENTHAEFVEVCNPGDQAVDLSGWYMQRKTKTGDWSTFAPKSVLNGKTIAPHGYITLAISDSPVPHDVDLSYGLTADNSLVLKNPQGEISDMVGWGEASGCEGNCASAPPAGNSISRKYVSGLIQDSQDNSVDFTICANPSPGAIQSACLPPTVLIPAQTQIAVNESASTNQASSPLSSEQTRQAASSAVVIYEVRTSGGEGKTTEDHVILLNLGPDVADLSGWKLRKRTSSGSESSVKVLPSGVLVSVMGRYTWANSTNGYAARIAADVSSTATLADDNSIALEDAFGVVKDALAWGSSTNPFIEGSPAVNIPATQALRRKENGGVVQDTGDNSADFILL